MSFMHREIFMTSVWCLELKSYKSIFGNIHTKFIEYQTSLLVQIALEQNFHIQNNTLEELAMMVVLQFAITAMARCKLFGSIFFAEWYCDITSWEKLVRDKKFFMLQ